MKKLIFLLFTTAFSFHVFTQEKTNIELEDIYSREFYAEGVYGLRSMNDGEHYTTLDADEKGAFLHKYAYKNGKEVTTIRISDNKDLSVEEYSYSADESKVLLATEIEKIYRHSTKEFNYVYDFKTKKSTPLNKEAKQSYATFSPAGNKVAFVSNNNLFVKDFTNGNSKQITKDGEFNKIINGATDWVYEEEFAFDKAFFWSPDGKKVAFYRFDETNVPEFSMDMYGELYPTQYKFKYPKAGEENSKVTIHIYNLETNDLFTPELGEYEYIPRVKWTNDANWLSIQKMNRHQNQLDLMLVNPTSKEVKTILHEESKTYIDITDNLTFLNDKKHFIWTSEKSGFNHIYLYDISGKEIRQITKGEWDVAEYLGYNESIKTVYYLSHESAPINKELYSISVEGENKTKLSEKEGQNSVAFSKGFKYYINTNTQANTPKYVSLHNGKGKQIRVLKDNQRVVDALAKRNISNKEFFSFKTSTGTELNGWMIKPLNFDESKKYPVLQFVYGGPGSQTVKNGSDSNYMWYQHLASKGYMIVSVDNRGTGARGEEFKKCTYKQLGKLEVEDQIETAKYLGSLPFVNKERIGIWGWSYGGYMSSNCITQGADYFKAAIAVAPVSTWRYYDSIYTERYMQTPQENASGYDDNSPINHVEKLKGNYLLVHGTADDNVHFQNAIDLHEALVQANKQFDFMAYRNRNHGIYGGNTRLHLYTLMTNFILENL